MRSQATLARPWAHLTWPLLPQCPHALPLALCGGAPGLKCPWGSPTLRMVLLLCHPVTGANWYLQTLLLALDVEVTTYSRVDAALAFPH